MEVFITAIINTSFAVAVATFLLVKVDKTLGELRDAVKQMTAVLNARLPRVHILDPETMD